MDGSSGGGAVPGLPSDGGQVGVTHRVGLAWTDRSSRPYLSPNRTSPRLTHLDQATGLPVRPPKTILYEHAAPGDLAHVDIKKQGRIPDGGGHRKLGRTIGNRNRNRNRNRNNNNKGRASSSLHHAVDNHSRLAYSEILTDEKKETDSAFWVRANAFFESHGITVTRVLTDNGSCYRSRAFTTALGEAIPMSSPAPTGRRPSGKSNA